MNQPTAYGARSPGQSRPARTLLPAIGALLAAATVAALGWLRWLRDGRVVDEEVAAHVIVAGALVLVGAVWIARIRASSRAAHLARVADDTLAAIVDSALDAIITVDEAHRVTVFNPAAEKLFGLPRSSALGRPLTDFLPARTDDDHITAMYSTLEMATMPAVRFGVEGEIVGRRANGEEFHAEGSFSAATVDGKRFHTVFLRDVTPLRVAEEARRTSEAMLAEAQQLVHLGSWEWSIGSDRVIWSDELYRIHGMPPQSRSLVYEDWLATVHPDDRPMMLAFVGAALTRGTPYETDLRVRHADGSYRVLHAQGRAVLDDKGAVVRLIGTSMDVTAQRAVEEARRESEERFSRSFSLVGIGMAVASPDGRYMEVNPTLARMLGYEPREMIGRPFREFTHPDDIAADLEGLRETIEGTRDHFEREKRYVHRDGHAVWVALNVTLVRDGAGAPSHFVTHVQDISTRKRTEEALQRSEASYRAFVENSPFGIYRSTMGGRFLEVNRAVVKMLGYATTEEVLALDMTTQVYADPAYRSELLRRNARERQVQDAFAEWKKKDGTVITVRLRARHVHDHLGGVVYIETFVEDVTPLRAAENALRQAEKLAAVGQLVSGVAHELNNPLSAIMHFVEDLQGDERPPSDREALTQIREQARRSRAIVRDLLTFARDQSGRRDRVRCSDVLRGVSASAAPQIAEYGTRLSVTADCGDAWLEVDLSGLEQVITNLVINAAQAAGPGGAVSVSSAFDVDQCRIFVEDTGPGIPPDVMPRIFEPFFSTKPTGVGTGLGLPVSLGIVTQLGGTLRAENRTTSEGGGARFIVTLPCTSPGEFKEPTSPIASLPPLPPSTERTMDVPTPPPPQPGAPVPPGAPRVLIIDDESTIRMALKRFFTRRGWAVDEAPEGQTGIDKLLTAGNEYTAIISDLRMPGFSGIELHDRLERERPALLDRLIFSTGDVASGEAAGFVARTRCTVLLKPFELSTLADAITRIQTASGQDAAPGG